MKMQFQDNFLLPQRHHNGFALVITLALMVLLALLSIGLLSLSSVSLRSSNQSEAMALARANARMALMIALGELQKNAGPDTRITAAASIRKNASPGQRPIAGAWRSAPTWAEGSGSPQPHQYAGNEGKSDEFLGWLVSNSNPSATENLAYVNSELSGANRIAVLPAAANAAASPAVFAERVFLSGDVSAKQGAYAYAVFDEGVKVRVDSTYARQQSNQSVGDLAATMGSALRPDISRISGMETLDWETANVTSAGNGKSVILDKIVSHKTADLAMQKLNASSGDDYEALRNDVSISSLGVLADVANGGLKQDLNSILQKPALPAEYAGVSNSLIYTSHLDYSPNFPSSTGLQEPTWGQFHSFFTDIAQSVKNPTTAPVLDMVSPDNWTNDAIPPTANTNASRLLPSLMKMQIIYSLMAIPLWNAAYQGAPMDPNAEAPKPGQWTHNDNETYEQLGKDAWEKGARYFMVACMTPVVTLHNPYNMRLQVDDLGVELKGIPIAAQFKRQGLQSTSWVPSGYIGADLFNFQRYGGTISRRISMALTEDGSKKKFTMEPGEIVMFSPIQPATTTYQKSEYREINAFTATGMKNNKPITMAKGWRNHSTGIYQYRLTSNQMAGYEGKNSYEYLAPDDVIEIRTRPALDKRFGNSAADGKGKSQVSLVQAGGGSNRKVYSTVVLDLGTDSAQLLQNYYNRLETTLGFTVQVVTAPVSEFRDPQWRADPPLTEIPSFPFVMLTIGQKTTHGSMAGQNEEGNMQGKPMTFHSSLTPYLYTNVKDNGVGATPYEVTLLPLFSSGTGEGVEKYIDTDSHGRSYGITGLSSDTGHKYGTVYEIPLGSIQNFMQLNSANPAATNSTVRFTYPIGNSWAHPNINTGEIRNLSIPGALDHSYLLNSLLFDRFYFSGIADPHPFGKFGTPINPSTLAQGFYQGGANNQLRDQRLTAYLPDGETQAEAIQVLSGQTTPDETHRRVAAHQLVKGSFNVNSASKLAWKSMLAALHPAANTPMLHIDGGSSQAGIKVLNPLQGDSLRFSRFLLPNNNAATSAADSQQVLQGPRDITDGELDQLAEEIVKQVRERGPFLNMGEFVNRQIGASSELSLKGALQAAIDNTGINGNQSVLSNTGYTVSNVNDLVDRTHYASPAAMLGRTDQGAPAYLTQADLLSVLGNAATVRSDTFTIRAYGEAKNGNGVVRAWCEAVVQRIPEFVDDTDLSHAATAELTPTNQKFGRRFVIQAFRWIPSEGELPKI